MRQAARARLLESARFRGYPPIIAEFPSRDRDGGHRQLRTTAGSRCGGGRRRGRSGSGGRRGGWCGRRVLVAIVIVAAGMAVPVVVVVVVEAATSTAATATTSVPSAPRIIPPMTSASSSASLVITRATTSVSTPTLGIITSATRVARAPSRPCTVAVREVIEVVLHHRLAVLRVAALLIDLGLPLKHPTADFHVIEVNDEHALTVRDDAGDLRSVTLGEQATGVLFILHEGDKQRRAAFLLVRRRGRLRAGRCVRLCIPWTGAIASRIGLQRWLIRRGGGSAGQIDIADRLRRTRLALVRDRWAW